MSRLGNKTFSFVSADSEETNHEKRKELRREKLAEAVTFWRNIVNGRMMVIENMHPLTRKTMNEAIRSYKASVKTL